MRVSDRISVMRDGKVVFTAPTDKTDPRELAHQMIGRDVLTELPARVVTPGRVALPSKSPLPERPRVAGGARRLLRGSRGRDCRPRRCFGQRPARTRDGAGGFTPATAGTITLNGEEISALSSRAINQRPFAHVSEDCAANGVVLPLPLTENAILQRYDRAPFATLGFLRVQAIESHTHALVHRFNVRTDGIHAAIKAFPAATSKNSWSLGNLPGVPISC